jgi:hypothetical protein
MQTNQMSLNRLRGLGIFSLIAEALALPPPGSDAIEFRSLRTAKRPNQASLPRRGALERIERWFWARHQRNVEAYLGRATDIYDVEARIRALERTVPFP